MKVFVSVLLCCMFHASPAQQQNKFRLATTVQAGVMHGKSTDHVHLEAMTGLQYKTWQAAVGAGLDYYYWRSVPAFINVTKNFTQRQQTPFLSLALGINFPWIKEEDDYQWEEFKYHRGFYGKAEAGYRLPVNKRTSFHISLGYSKKEMHADKIYYSYRGPGFSPPEKYETSREYYSFYFNRLCFSAGLTF